MVKSLVPAGTVIALLALAGCSTPNDRVAMAPSVLPFSATRHGASQVDAHYAIGRYYQGQVRYDQAILGYQEVLALQPDHAEAHNALGVIYAIQGRWSLAETELQAALKLAPDAAHIHNNLGYARLLQGRPESAVAEFEAALRLDPGNARSADNLHIARASLAGSPEDVRPGSRQPAGNGPAALPEVAPLRVETAPSGHLVAVNANIYELRLPGREQPRAPGVAKSATARVEVANGNGIDGLARRTSAYLQQAGYATVRLTNQKPYDQMRTEIQYRPGFAGQARQLQDLLAGGASLAESSRLRQDVEVRVLLGKDLRTSGSSIAAAAAGLRAALPAGDVLARN